MAQTANRTPTPRRRGFKPRAAAIVALALAGSMAACAQEAREAGSRNSAIAPLPSFAPLVDQVMPAVVSVAVLEKQEARDDEQERLRSQLEELLRRFLARPGERGTPLIPHPRRIALGSGFIIDPAGYIVTDDHVVANASKIIVLFQDKTEHAARLVGRDAITDVALLKVDAQKPLPSVPWGDSQAARVGDWVLAVGNPFGRHGELRHHLGAGP